MRQKGAPRRRRAGRGGWRRGADARAAEASYPSYVSGEGGWRGRGGGAGGGDMGGRCEHGGRMEQGCSKGGRAGHTSTIPRFLDLGATRALWADTAISRQRKGGLKRR